MKKTLTIFLLLFTGLVSFAQKDFDPAVLLKGTSTPALVNDYSAVLTVDQKQTLEAKLDAFDDSTTTQVAIVIIPGLGDYDISDYAVKLLRAWGIGSKKNNNGVLLVVCTDPNEHRIFITTGYGIEGALPDVTCKDIIDNVITPNFKGGDFYAGLNLGIDAIIKATKGEYTAPDDYNKSNDDSGGGKVFIIIIIIIFVLKLLSAGGGKGGGRGGGFFTPFFLGSMMGGGFGGGGSSSGGGGFGGFGGGSGGGGGAGGSW